MYNKNIYVYEYFSSALNTPERGRPAALLIHGKSMQFSVPETPVVELASRNPRDLQSAAVSSHARTSLSRGT